MKTLLRSAIALLALAAAQRLPAQAAGGIQVRHAAPVAIAGESGSAESFRASGLGGEPVQAGRTVSASYVLESGARLPEGVARLLHYALSSGWQLLGAPGVSDRTTGEIFVGAAGASVKVGPIQYYNCMTLRYERGSNDEPIRAREGFWLFSYWGGESRTFAAASEVAAAGWLEEIPVGRWVLYSPPGKIILPALDGVTVYAWNTLTQSYGEPLEAGDELLPLHGYWVYRTPEE